MTRVVQPNQAPKHHPGKPNQVIRCTEVRTFAVVYTNADGREAMCLVNVFGKDTTDNGTGVYILAEETQMIEQLKVAGKTVKEGVRKWLASKEEVTEATIPVGMLGKDEKPAAGSFDASNVEVGGGE